MENLFSLSDPVQPWNFDLIVEEPSGEKAIWEAIKVKVKDGMLTLTQAVLEKDGSLDLAGKVVKLRVYSSTPEVLFDMEYEVGKLQDADISLDVTTQGIPLELTLVYDVKLRGIVRNKNV